VPDEPLLASLKAAVEAAPHDGPLRLHLAELLSRGDSPAEALPHVSHLLAIDPTDEAALDLLAAVSNRLAGTPPRAPDGAVPAQGADTFNWPAAEEELSGIAPPMFVDGTDGSPPTPAGELERPALRLADVGGMERVKERLNAAFLAPLQNPELRKLYAKSLRGGLLLYGPPGCGKTFLARAVAGELGAAFYSVSLADVLDMFIGQSERNLHQVFETVRRHAPCVLFLDEIDALGQKRSQVRGSAMRGAVNQLLTELDDVGQSNDGVFVLAATNHPWDIDSALRRPGRLDRMLLVLPPDPAARQAILKHHLKDRPVGGIDLVALARQTEGFSGADLAHLCDSAAEVALLDSARTGEVRLIRMDDFRRGLAEIQPSTGPWFQSARNVAMFANASGEYDELLTYLKKQKLV
jgi:SpoVK/Ycf46/Vps4 family AAA+-type ATPase